MPYVAETICFSLSSTVGEQRARHAADAGGKQAEAADSVNHSFTASMLWGMEAEAGGSVHHAFFFSFSIALKILSTPLVLSAELFCPGPLLY